MRISVQRLRHIMDLCAPAIHHQATGNAQYVLFKDSFAVSNNLQMAIAAALPEVGEETFLIPHRTLRESLKYIPANTLLDISGDGMSITVTGVTGGFSTTLRNSEAVQFPDFPEVERIGGGAVDGDDLVKNLSEVLSYASKLDHRPVLTGICLSLGEELEVAAADGYRLAWRVLPIRLPAGQDQAPTVVIPALTFRALEQLWRAADKLPRPSETLDPARLTANPQLEVASLATGRRFVQIDFGVSRVSFNVGEATLISNTIEGQFPNYHNLIPETATHSVVFDAGTAYRAVRQLAPVAAAGAGLIRLEWRRNQLTFRATSDDVGESAVTFDATIKGRTSRIAFNIKYLLELLKDKDGPILMETNEPSAPGRFTNYASPDILIMSMATNEAREAAATTTKENDDDGSEYEPEADHQAPEENKADTD